jgi:acyl-CoA thioesterase-2
MKSVEELLDILVLEKVGECLFSGVSKTIGSPQVFGGQVLAQAINAAYRTITNQRKLHSLHSYFLEAGNLSLPISYEVDVMRDGGSFSTRRVTAKQDDVVIFILAASFHSVEDGYEHQITMKKGIKQPEELLSWAEMLINYGDFMSARMKEFLEIERPFEFKPTVIVNPLDKKDLAPFADTWFRLKGDASTLDMATKQQILTYVSDYNILTSTLYPNASTANRGNVRMASLDHSMWFFRDFDFNDWMLFTTESPSTYGARGFARGHIYSRNGDLIASVAQEGLMRPIKS